MSRSQVHDIKNNFGQGLTPAHTGFSGGVSLVGPASGNHLRVYKIQINGPADQGSAAEIEVQDGSGSIMHTFPVKASGEASVDFGSRYLRFDTAVRFTRGTAIDDLVFGSVFYTENVNQ